jgi:hypothetical protein
MAERRAFSAAGLAVIVTASAVALWTPMAGANRSALTVRSTLAGRSLLPHRIHWLGITNLSASKIREVDFAIDGKLAWVEHHAPYSYGYDGNYLVTSWLTPGTHQFAVTAIATDGTRASAFSSARTTSPAAPPPSLAGHWSRTITATEAGVSGRPGRWTLVVDSVGWRILDPSRHGARVDAAYLSSDTLEIRGGIATRNHDSREGNIWCDEPFQPVRYHWLVSGDTVTLALTGPKRCDGQSQVIGGSWLRG